MLLILAYVRVTNFQIPTESTFLNTVVAFLASETFIYLSFCLRIERLLTHYVVFFELDEN